MNDGTKKEKLRALFDHITGLAMKAEGPEAMVKLTGALREVNWIIRAEEEKEEQHGRTEAV